MMEEQKSDHMYDPNERVIQKLLEEFEFDKLDNLEKVIDSDVKRQQKFEKIIGSVETYMKKKPKQFSQLIRGGIPLPTQRRILWKRICCWENGEIKKDLYENLLRSEYDRGVYKRILKDVKRTFPKYKFFKSGLGQKQLEKVLRAYSVLDNKVGYMQGMCFIVGFLLMHLSEEETFYVFVNLMNNEKYDWKGIFEPGLRTLKKLLTWVDVLLEVRDPALSKHFNQMLFHPEMYAVNFICTLFTNYCKFETCTRIWDLYLNESWPFIIRLIVGMLSKLKPELLKLGFCEISPRLHDFCRALTPDNMVKLYLDVKFNGKTLKLLEESYVKKLTEEEREAYIERQMEKEKEKEKEKSSDHPNAGKGMKKESKGLGKLFDIIENFLDAFKSVDSSYNPEDIGDDTIDGNDYDSYVKEIIEEEEAENEKIRQSRRERRVERRKMKSERITKKFLKEHAPIVLKPIQSVDNEKRIFDDEDDEDDEESEMISNELVRVEEELKQVEERIRQRNRDDSSEEEEEELEGEYDRNDSSGETTSSSSSVIENKPNEHVKALSTNEIFFNVDDGI